jgi:DNA invertase Pin-like site-specific DNA recombinase
VGVSRRTAASWGVFLLTGFAPANSGTSRPVACRASQPLLQPLSRSLARHAQDLVCYHLCHPLRRICATSRTALKAGWRTESFKKLVKELGRGQIEPSWLAPSSESAPGTKRSSWEVVKVYQDAGISGAKGRDQRPGLDAMMKAVNAKEFDMVASWSVDRLGRSLTDLLSILQGLHDKGVGLFLHQQGLDTTTSAGKAMFQMLGVFAEFERGIIRERVNAGLARARANGVKLGRRRVKPSVEAQIVPLRDKGYGILKIGKKLGIGTSVVQRVFKEVPWV